MEEKTCESVSRWRSNLTEEERKLSRQDEILLEIMERIDHGCTIDALEQDRSDFRIYINIHRTRVESYAKRHHGILPRGRESCGTKLYSHGGNKHVPYNWGIGLTEKELDGLSRGQRVWLHIMEAIDRGATLRDLEQAHDVFMVYISQHEKKVKTYYDIVHKK